MGGSAGKFLKSRSATTEFSASISTFFLLHSKLFLLVEDDGLGTLYRHVGAIVHPWPSNVFFIEWSMPDSGCSVVVLFRRCK
jgi:hypothetical protein